MAEWDLEDVVELVKRDVNGIVPEPRIREVINEIITKYDDAKVRTFIPIFVRRETVERLYADSINNPGQA